MTIDIQDSKTLRGTKRMCAACEVPFYDLKRQPIVCPSCGGEHIPAARPMIELGQRAASHTGKTGWRSRNSKRPDPEPDAAEASAAGEEAPEEEAAAVVEEDEVLEQETEEANVSDLVGHDAVDPKEQH